MIENEQWLRFLEFEKRPSFCTGSEMDKVLMRSHFLGIRDLFYEKLYPERPRPQYDNCWMKFGRDNEEKVIDMFKEAHPELIVEKRTFAYAPCSNWFGGTIDALAYDPQTKERSIIEVKCPRKTMSKPTHRYMLQIQTYMHLYRTTKCYFIQYEQTELRYSEQIIDRDDERVKCIRDCSLDFMYNVCTRRRHVDLAQLFLQTYIRSWIECSHSTDEEDLNLYYPPPVQRLIPEYAEEKEEKEDETMMKKRRVNEVRQGVIDYVRWDGKNQENAPLHKFGNVYVTSLELLVVWWYSAQKKNIKEWRCAYGPIDKKNGDDVQTEDKKVKNRKRNATKPKKEQKKKPRFKVVDENK